MDPIKTFNSERKAFEKCELFLPCSLSDVNKKSHNIIFFSSSRLCVQGLYLWLLKPLVSAHFSSSHVGS